MLCMICQQDVKEQALICPKCGAMPWKMPTSFLNAEQHHIWMETVFKPQLDRWNNSMRIIEENQSLRDEITRLQAHISELEVAANNNNENSASNSNTTTSISYDISLPENIVPLKAFRSQVLIETDLNKYEAEEIFRTLEICFQYSQYDEKREQGFYDFLNGFLEEKADKDQLISEIYRIIRDLASERAKSQSNARGMGKLSLKTDEFGIVKKCAVGEYPKSWIGRSQAAW